MHNTYFFTHDAATFRPVHFFFKFTLPDSRKSVNGVGFSYPQISHLWKSLYTIYTISPSHTADENLMQVVRRRQPPCVCCSACTPNWVNLQLIGKRIYTILARKIIDPLCVSESNLFAAIVQKNRNNIYK